MISKTFKYEDLVDSPGQVLSRLVECMGISCADNTQEAVLVAMSRDSQSSAQYKPKAQYSFSQVSLVCLRVRSFLHETLNTHHHRSPSVHGWMDVCILRTYMHTRVHTYAQTIYRYMHAS
jgi:hypothetical protein